MQKQKFIRYVEIATIIFLAIPNFIFLLGFLNLFWASASSVSLLFAIYYYFKNTNNTTIINHSDIIPNISIIPYRLIILAFVFALIFTAISGAGGWGYQTADWHKHIAMLSHLAFQQWPVVLELDKGNFLLIYYVAYYLPAALISKIFDFNIANHFLAFYTTACLFLVLCWLLIYSKKLIWWIFPCFFIFSSGLDILLLNVEGGGIESRFVESIPLHRGIPAHITGFFLIPAHAISSWLVFFLCLKNITLGQSKHNIGLLITLGMLWSILSAFGVLMFMLIYWAYDWVNNHQNTLITLWKTKYFFKSTKTITKQTIIWFTPFFSIQNILIILPAISVMLYLATNDGVPKTMLVPDIRNIFRAYFWPYLFVDFFILWTVLLGINYYMKKQGHDFLKQDFYVLYWLAGIFIFITYNYNFYNLQRNSSYIGTIIIFFAVMRSFDCFALMKKKTNLFLVTIWVLLLVTSLVAPVERLTKSTNVAIIRITENGTPHRPVEPIFIEIADVHPHLHITTPLYLGDLNGVFYRYFAKKPKP